MPKAGTEMTVILKCYDFMLWTTNHIVKFPRSHRFTLGARMESQLRRVLELLVRARYSPERVSVLREVNLELELMRFEFRFAKDLRCLPLDSYGHAARAVDEIGRLVGAWIKSSRVPAEPKA
jgi:hypothetical protein